MATRTGIPTIVKLAKEMCRLITKFTPIIKKAYPNATNFHEALDAANSACALIVAAADLVLEYGD